MTKHIMSAAVGLGVVLGGCWSIYAVSTNKVSFGYNNNYEPDQPIPYSHKLHAGQLGIDCKYCHNTVEVSRHASIPPLNVCMNCHIQIRQVGGKDSPHLAKLVEAFESGNPIQWKKVHLLPDYVRFNHAPHIKAGRQCEECHGPIREMDVVKQYKEMSMGWCVDCHRQQNKPALTNCITCHY